MLSLSNKRTISGPAKHTEHITMHNCRKARKTAMINLCRSIHSVDHSALAFSLFIITTARCNMSTPGFIADISQNASTTRQMMTSELILLDCSNSVVILFHSPVTLTRFWELLSMPLVYFSRNSTQALIFESYSLDYLILEQNWIHSSHVSFNSLSKILRHVTKRFFGANSLCACYLRSVISQINAETLRISS